MNDAMNDAMGTTRVADMMQADVAVQLDYVPGDWVGVAGPGLWLLIEAEPSAPIVREYWQLIRRGTSATDVLDTVYLYSAQSQGFAFVAVGPDSTRAVVRGNASIRLLASTDAPVTVLDGAGDTFLDWRAIGFQLTAGSISQDPVALVAGRPLLPLESGVVQASAILWNEAFAVRPTPAAPVPALAAEPEPEPDPDLAPTEIVVPQPVVDDPDLAPTQFVAPRTVAPSALLAPPSGPRIEVEPVFEQIEQGAQIVEVEPLPGPEADPDADESLIWKLDWWGTADKPPAPAATVSQPLVQPAPQLLVPPPMPPATAPEPVVAEPLIAEPVIAEPVAFEAFEPELAAAELFTADPVEDDTSVTVHRPGNASPGADTAGQRPSVPAVRCPDGHLNPPAATQCRVCAAAVPPQESFPVPQPVLGVLRLSTGGDIPLDRDVFLGRDPSHSEERMARKPHLLRLPSPGKDISRDHLEVRLVGWRVMAIDLGSVNGTTVIAPGAAPEALAAGASRMIEPGTQVVLADEVSFVYEVPR